MRRGGGRLQRYLKDKFSFHRTTPDSTIAEIGVQFGDDWSDGLIIAVKSAIRPAKDLGSMIASSDKTLGKPISASRDQEMPTQSSGWILSGFDSNGMAVRLNISEMDLRAGPDGLIVGRSASKAMLVLKDDSVSRAHARIALGDRLTMEDLKSSNGTRVNGRMLAASEKMPIEQGAAIEIGAVRLTLTRS